MKTLTEDDKDILRDMADEQYQVVVRITQLLVQKQEEALLSYTLTKDHQEFILLKARLDGAKILANGISRAKRELTKEKSDGR